MLSQRIQRILLRIHLYRVRIIYKPESDLFITEWLSRQNHKENIDAEIPGKQLNDDVIQTTTNIPDCMMIQQLQQATLQDEHLQQLKEHIIKGLAREQRSNTTGHVTYWTFQDDKAVIVRIILKGMHEVVPESLQRQALEQLHVNHMGIEKKINSCHVNQFTGKYQ